MADEQDESQKTEEPTQKRLQDARGKGQVAKSQEIGHWFMILALTITTGFFANSVAGGLGQSLYGFIARPHAMRVDIRALTDLMGELMATLGWALLPLVVLAVVAAAASSLVQNGFLLSLEPIKPKLEKLSPLKGFSRLFSLRALVEFAKGIVKLTVVGSAVAFLLWPERHLLTAVITMELPQFLDLVNSLALRVLIVVLAVMTVVAGLDFLFQKLQHNKQLRMSKQELKDEFKQAEGDPMVRGRLRQIRMERARRRMMAAVPEADVVIANPTHFAVALSYQAGTVGAPRVTARGMDHVALKIRELAEQHNVPVIENPPLARALYDGVKLDQEIPEKHYKAVAEIIGYVLRLKGKLAGPAVVPRVVPPVDLPPVAK